MVFAHIHSLRRFFEHQNVMLTPRKDPLYRASLIGNGTHLDEDPKLLSSSTPSTRNTPFEYMTRQLPSTRTRSHHCAENISPRAISPNRSPNPRVESPLNFHPGTHEPSLIHAAHDDSITTDYSQEPHACTSVHLKVPLIHCRIINFKKTICETRQIIHKRRRNKSSHSQINGEIE